MAYSILFKQCGSDHMTRGRSCAIDRIVVHFTATLASARNNATYFARNEGRGASAHYFVDDITPEIYQSVAEGDTAWHAGDWQMNCRAIGIEVVSAGEDFSATEVEKLGWLVRKLMAKYGIGASGVIRHCDVTGKLCPAPYGAASKWAALKAAITCGAASGGTTEAAPSGTVEELARRVIAGEFGNGDARRAALGSRYPEVQAEVNRILAGGSGGGAAQAPASDDVDELARRVIAGEFGNGAARKAALRGGPGARERAAGRRGLWRVVRQRGRRRAGACGDPWRLRQRRGAQAPPGESLRRRAGARERDPVVTREDARWGVATALAVLLCLGALPLVPLLWLAGRLDP